MRGLKFGSAFGPVEYRAIDHQSTLGAYVGRLDVKDGKGVMVDWTYRDGAKYLPSDDVVKSCGRRLREDARIPSPHFSVGRGLG